MATSKEVQINLRNIQERAAKDERFRELMKYLASRGRGRGKTAYARAKRVLNEGGGRNWTYEELDQYFRFLEKEGAAEVDLHRSGDPQKAYVRWNVDLKSLGAAALSKAKAPAVAPVPPPRLNLPKAAQLSVMTLDNNDQVVGHAAPIQATQVSDNVVRVPYRGFEFEIDLDKVPNDLMKFIRRL